MELLHKTTMKYTFEEYKKFNKSVMKKRIKKVYITLIVLLVMAFLLWYINPFSSLPLFLVLFILIYPIMLNIGTNKAVKKCYNSNELLKDINQTLEFYENHFIAITDKSEANIEYDKLYEILENKTNFYLMIGDNQGYLVLKEKCSKELISFIEELKNKIARKKRG